MENKLSLIKNEVGTQEKKKLPRFPFCYLTFKCDSGDERVFEVMDISHSGMQLSLKSGEVHLKKGELFKGKLHWVGDKLEIKSKVIWQTSNRIGVEFANDVEHRKAIDEFLTLKRFARHMKPIHELKIETELPLNLNYWLRSDGPVEVFVWSGSSTKYQCFQILIMEHFVEWEDGLGLRTGRVLSKRDLDSPLLSEDEFVFLFDSEIDRLKLERAGELVKELSSDLLPPDCLEFLTVKLGL